MITYCVKERKLTDNVPGSEHYQKAKNGRLMLKSKYASCGIIKTQFISQNGKGISDEVFKSLFKAVGRAAKTSAKNVLKK